MTGPVSEGMLAWATFALSILALRFVYLRLLAPSLRRLSMALAAVTFSVMTMVFYVVRYQYWIGAVITAVKAGGLVWLLRRPSRAPVAVLLGLEILVLVEWALTLGSMSWPIAVATLSLYVFNVYHVYRAFGIVRIIREQSLTTETTSKEVV